MGMDWLNVEPDVYRLLNKHFTPGRGGRKIKYIVRHHNAGVLTIDGCWEVWQTREASAHYQVENSGRIGQLVNDSDTAWHAADLVRNQESIGIEHANCGGANQDWPISDLVIKQGARLAAALCLYYDLGRPEFGTNIRDHRETGQTSCPYHLARGGKYHGPWMAEAQRFYDELKAQKEGRSPVAPPPPQPNGGTMTELSGVSAAALNDAKLAAIESADRLRAQDAPITSIVNPDVKFSPRDLAAVQDLNSWCALVLAKAIARKLGLDPETIISTAIADDRARTGGKK